MKTLFAAVALAAVLASPALAQTVKKGRAAAAYLQQTPGQAFAAQPLVLQRRPHSPNPGYDVYGWQGDYVGSDPDPHVRRMLQSDSFPGSDN